MKGVQCYELFGGVALKNHEFSIRLSQTFSNAMEYDRTTKSQSKSRHGVTCRASVG